MSKQGKTVIMIKTKFLSATSHKGPRLKIIQSNNCKSIIVPMDYSMNSIISQIYNYFENIEDIESYNMVIDNIQNNLFVFVVNYEGYETPDIIEKIKELVNG